MFEGFYDGPWDYGDDLPPPKPPEWWEVLFVVCGLVGLLGLAIKLFFYGI